MGGKWTQTGPHHNADPRHSWLVTSHPPPPSPWDKFRSQWLGLWGLKKEGWAWRGARARSEAAWEQAPPPGPGPLRGCTGGKGPGCRAGGTESGCLLSTSLGGGREAFRPTSASQRGDRGRASPSPIWGRIWGFLSAPYPAHQQGLRPLVWNRVFQAPQTTVIRRGAGAGAGGPLSGEPARDPLPPARSRPSALYARAALGPAPSEGEQVNQRIHPQLLSF